MEAVCGSWEVELPLVGWCFGGEDVGPGVWKCKIQSLVF